MIAKLYQFSLNAMEKLDKRNNAFEKLGYWFANKIYLRSLAELYDMSPYDNVDEHDRWQDHQEYIARQSEDYDYE
mgnify:FL=1